MITEAAVREFVLGLLRRASDSTDYDFNQTISAAQMAAGSGVRIMARQNIAVLDNLIYDNAHARRGQALEHKLLDASIKGVATMVQMNPRPDAHDVGEITAVNITRLPNGGYLVMGTRKAGDAALALAAVGSKQELLEWLCDELPGDNEKREPASPPLLTSMVSTLAVIEETTPTQYGPRGFGGTPHPRDPAPPPTGPYSVRMHSELRREVERQIVRERHAVEVAARAEHQRRAAMVTPMPQWSDDLQKAISALDVAPYVGGTARSSFLGAGSVHPDASQNLPNSYSPRGMTQKDQNLR